MCAEALRAERGGEAVGNTPDLVAFCARTPRPPAVGPACPSCLLSRKFSGLGSGVWALPLSGRGTLTESLTPCRMVGMTPPLIHRGPWGPGTMTFKTLSLALGLEHTVGAGGGRLESLLVSLLTLVGYSQVRRPWECHFGTRFSCVLSKRALVLETRQEC